MPGVAANSLVALLQESLLRGFEGTLQNGSCCLGKQCSMENGQLLYRFGLPTKAVLMPIDGVS